MYRLCHVPNFCFGPTLQVLKTVNCRDVNRYPEIRISHLRPISGYEKRATWYPKTINEWPAIGDCVPLPSLERIVCWYSDTWYASLAASSSSHCMWSSVQSLGGINASCKLQGVTVYSCSEWLSTLLLLLRHRPPAGRYTQTTHCRSLLLATCWPFHWLHTSVWVWGSNHGNLLGRDIVTKPMTISQYRDIALCLSAAAAWPTTGWYRPLFARRVTHGECMAAL